jgi:hypothetical protein
MSPGVRARRVRLDMYARAIDEASERLGELRREERDDLCLALLALGLAVGATQVLPALALPLLVGGLVLGVRGMTALWRRWDLVDRLAGERDAYVISEVLACAAREATLERRRDSAAVIRGLLRQPGGARVDAVADELELLACELADSELELDPASAVACTRLLSDVGSSPLFNRALPQDELCSRIRQIRAGFSPSASIRPHR